METQEGGMQGAKEIWKGDIEEKGAGAREIW